MQLVIFSLQNKLYGIPSENVEEITENVDWTEVPKSPSWILGLINLRGNIISLLDFDRLVNFKEDIYDSDNLCYNNTIIVKKEKEKVALAVNKVQEVVDIDEKDLQLKELQDEVIRGVYSRNDAVVNFVDLEVLFSKNEEAI